MNKSKTSKNAQKYLAKGQIDKAIKEWELLLQGDEFDGNLHNTIGDLYLRQKNIDKAVESFKKAASIFRQDGFAQKAKGIFKKIVNVLPADIDSLEALGELDKDKGLAAIAVAYYLKALQICLKKGDKERGLGLVKKTSALASDNPTLIERIGDTYLAAGLTRQAASEYTRLAADFENKNDIEKAHFFYAKSLETEEKNFHALVGLSRIEEIKGNLTTAFQYCHKAVANEPDNSDVLLRYAELSLKIKRPNGAISSLERLIQLDPGNMKAKRLLERIKLGEQPKKPIDQVLRKVDISFNYGDCNGIIKMLEALTKEYPDKPEIQKRLQTIYRFKEDLSEADFYVQQGLFEEAIEIYENLLGLAPNNKTIMDKLKALKKGEFVSSDFDLDEELDDHISLDMEPVQEPQPAEDDKAVESVFKQFKKSVEKEVKVDDYETRYDLGIAYRQMGMIEDAIEEFKYSGDDIEKIKKSLYMTALCYMDKQLYDRAIAECKEMLTIIGEDDESYLDVKYMMAEMLEKNKAFKKARSIYKEIALKDSSFKDVAQKLSVSAK